MADDPTMTGPNPSDRESAEAVAGVEPPAESIPDLSAGGMNIRIGGKRLRTFPELTPQLRAIPRAHVTEVTPLSIDLRAELVFTVADNELRIAVKIKGRDGETTALEMSSPRWRLADFGDAAVLNAVLEDVKRNYLERLRTWLSFEAGLFARDIVAACAALHGVSRDHGEHIIRRHSEAAAAYLGEMLEKVPHKQAGWSKIALRNAVQVAASRLAFRGFKSREITLDAVRDEMRAEHGDLAPASGEALRKQLAERQINWRAAKVEAVRIGQEMAEAARAAEAGREAPGAETGGAEG